MKNLLKIIGKGYLKKYNKQYLNDTEFKVTKNGVNIIHGAKKSLRKNINFNLLVSYIDDLPKNIQEKLAKEKVLIRFIDKKEMQNFIPLDFEIPSYISKDKYSLLLAGLFHYTNNQKLIYINADTMFCPIKDTLFHEIGHFIDRYMFEQNKSSINNSNLNIDFYSQINSKIQNAYNNEKHVYLNPPSTYRGVGFFFIRKFAIIVNHYWKPYSFWRVQVRPIL